jgi:hypothetical protein
MDQKEYHLGGTLPYPSTAGEEGVGSITGSPGRSPTLAPQEYIEHVYIS